MRRRPITVPGVWHPVGPLPAAVYWRRRLVVLALALGLVAGLTWLAAALLGGPADGERATAAASTELPALDRVVPSVEAVRTPRVPEASTAAPSASPSPSPSPSPQAGGPCADADLAVDVRAPAEVRVGSKPTLELVVRNTGSVPCVRALDKELQELVLLDASGARVWGSNDCFPESSDDQRTLAPGEEIAMPLVWGGLTSEPTCSAQRSTPPAGSYVLRGRLDTKASGDAPLVLQ